jgi:hypothetical protein
MIDIVKLLIRSLLDCFKSRGRLEAEVTLLRHQVNILRRMAPKRVRSNALDRTILVTLYRLFPNIGSAVTIVRPETIVRWHRMGFRAWWRWKSRNLGGRPKIDRELRDLIQRMCKENPLWGAPRIHGELLKLASTSRSPRSRSTCSNIRDYRDRAGRRFSVITPMGSHRSIF